MPPIPQPLPISPRFSSAEEYVTSLLQFSSDPLFQTLCGGVHILDFFTREKPYDLYTTVLPKEWREYFSQHDIDDILDLLMRKDLEALDCQLEDGKTLCPKSLKNFIKEVRDHCLRREFTPNYDGGSSKNRGGLRMQKKRGEDLDGVEDRLRHLTVGMKPKKLHEVCG